MTARARTAIEQCLKHAIADRIGVLRRDAAGHWRDNAVGAYEAAIGRSLNGCAFRRKIDELRMVEQVSGSVSKATARPAQLFRLTKASVVEFDRTV